MFIDSIGIENSNLKNNFIAQGLTFLGFLEFCLHLEQTELLTPKAKKKKNLNRFWEEFILCSCVISQWIGINKAPYYTGLFVRPIENYAIWPTRGVHCIVSVLSQY